MNLESWTFVKVGTDVVKRKFFASCKPIISVSSSLVLLTALDRVS